MVTPLDLTETPASARQHAYILAEGQVIAEGAPAALLQDETVRRVYLGESFKL